MVRQVVLLSHSSRVHGFHFGLRCFPCVCMGSLVFTHLPNMLVGGPCVNECVHSGVGWTGSPGAKDVY